MNPMTRDQRRECTGSIVSAVNYDGIDNEDYQAARDDGRLGQFLQQIAEAREKFFPGSLDRTLVHPGNGNPAPQCSNPFAGDATEQQVYFEPAGWAEPLADQLGRLATHFPDAVADRDYLQQRACDPVPEGFFRVAFPAIRFYERRFGLRDGYKGIGTPISHICGLLKAQRRFTNWREGTLGPDWVYFHDGTEERRRDDEKKVPGDVMIIDVDLANRSLGRCQTCHTPRWSQEEVLLGNELFSLSAADVGVVILTNPKRLARYEDLCIDATAVAGTRYFAHRVCV